MSFQGIIRSAGCDLLVMLINNKFQTKLTDVLYSFSTRKIFSITQLKTMVWHEQEMVVSCLKKGMRSLKYQAGKKPRLR